jgi:glycerol-3-phosphate acyltransferase PlsY
MTLSILLFALGAYLLGSLPTGLILAKAFSAQDIRAAGSGNIGATNVTRVLGKKLGALTFLGDALKGYVPVWAGAVLFQSTQASCLFGGAAFLGHLFPVYLGFRGGKGVATAFGIFLYLAPPVALMAAALFAGVVAAWRYVSLGSLTVAALLPVLLALFSFPLPVVALSMLTGLLIFIKHKENIRRLLQGRENSVGQK